MSDSPLDAWTAAGTPSFGRWISPSVLLKLVDQEVDVDEQPSLGQLIWLVRRELEWAHGVDAEHPLRFDVGSVEVETDVQVSRVRKGEGGLDLKVLGIGGVKATGSQQSTQGTTSRVRLTMTPRDTRTLGGRFEVSALDTEPPPRRVGEPAPGEGTAP